MTKTYKNLEILLNRLNQLSGASNIGTFPVGSYGLEQQRGKVRVVKYITSGGASMEVTHLETKGTLEKILSAMCEAVECVVIKKEYNSKNY